MPRSSTNTPAPGRRYDSNSVWENSWYVPNTASSETNSPLNFKVKGWHKVPGNDQNETPTHLSNNDILELGTWKYRNDEYIAEPVVEVKEDKETEENKKELGNALSLNAQEGQISSLSGIA